MYHLYVFAFLFTVNAPIVQHEKNNQENCINLSLKEVITLNDEQEPIRIPVVYIDEAYNFILTDTHAHNVKIFDKTGEPIFTFGRYGRGPGDFELPTASTRNNNTIYTVSFGGKLTVWDFFTKDILHIENFPLMMVTNIKLINDNIAVMNGIRIGGNSIADKKRLHLVDLETYELIDSFFTESDEYAPYAGIVNSLTDILNFDVNDDNIVVSYGASAKVHHYKFSSYGVELINVQQLNVSDNFDSILDLNISDLLDIRTSASKYSTVSKLFYLDDGNIIIQIRKPYPLDNSGKYTGEDIFHYYHDLDSQQTCLLSINGSLATTDGKNLYVVNEEEYTVVHIYTFSH